MFVFLARHLRFHIDSHLGIPMGLCNGTTNESFLGISKHSYNNTKCPVIQLYFDINSSQVSVEIIELLCYLFSNNYSIACSLKSIYLIVEISKVDYIIV